MKKKMTNLSIGFIKLSEMEAPKPYVNSYNLEKRKLIRMYGNGYCEVQPFYKPISKII